MCNRISMQSAPAWLGLVQHLVSASSSLVAVTLQNYPNGKWLRLEFSDGIIVSAFLKNPFFLAVKPSENSHGRRDPSLTDGGPWHVLPTSLKKYIWEIGMAASFSFGLSVLTFASLVWHCFSKEVWGEGAWLSSPLLAIATSARRRKDWRPSPAQTPAYGRACFWHGNGKTGP